MKNALTYLVTRRLKNQIISIIRTPVKLIYALAMLVILGVTIMSGQMGEGVVDHRDLKELEAAVWLFFTLLFVLMANNGFNEGSSLFAMPDVNLLFPAPIPAQRVLFYGLLRQMTLSLMFGLFLLFQYSWLHQVYGLTYSGLLLIMLAYAIAVFCGQLVAMVLYSYTNSRPRRKLFWKIVFYGIIACYAVGFFIYMAMDRADFLSRMVTAATSLPARLFPFSGWVSAAFSGMLRGVPLLVMMGMGLCSAAVLTLVFVILVSNPDYYEDVLKTTETTYNALLAKREGRIPETLSGKVRKGRTGLTKGWGASAFYYKHLLENRRSRALILDGTSLIYVVVSIVFAFFMRDMGFLPAFMFSTYMLVFSVALGRINKELMKPYVYLVPEPPFRKMVACIRESYVRMILEAILVFVPIGLLLHLSPLDTALCIVARISYAFLFTAGNILVERVFGTLSSKVLVFVFYFLALLVVSTPGIVVAAVLGVIGTAILPGAAVPMLVLTAWNLAVGALLLYLCRNMLQYAELNAR